MKNLIILLIVFLAAVSCGKDDVKPSPAAPPVTPPSTTATSLVAGEFVSAPGETIKGIAKIVDDNGTKSLVFDDTFMASGPDLKVYMSIDVGASDYKSLGALKKSSGMQTYEIPASIDLAKYGKYIVVWCQKYSVRFGSAELK